MAQVLNRKNLRGPVTNSVYIGRPSIWGNPFVIGKDRTRNDVIEKYAGWVRQQPALMARVGDLKGKCLVCWCAPLRCHGDVLLQLTNETRKECA